MFKAFVISVAVLVATGNASAQQWQRLYEPISDGSRPYRLMKPINFDASKKYPVILSLHGAGGKGSDNRKQLKVWNGQLAEKAVRTKFPCYVLAPQAAGLWNARISSISRMLLRDCQQSTWTASTSWDIRWEGMVPISSYSLLPSTLLPQHRQPVVG